MKIIPIQYIHQPINITEGVRTVSSENAMLCCFISCTILKPILYHAVPDFNILVNPTSFMSTEFSEITLLRNILCMSTNQNQEHLINCIKKTFDRTSCRKVVSLCLPGYRSVQNAGAYIEIYTT